RRGVHRGRRLAVRSRRLLVLAGVRRQGAHQGARRRDDGGGTRHRHAVAPDAAKRLMTPRRTALLFGGVAAAVTVGIAIVAAEVALRALDGYGFPPHLRTAEPRRAVGGTAPGADAKWMAPSQAEPYVRRLPIAGGVDRAWFTLDPVKRDRKPSNALLDR